MGVRKGTRLWAAGLLTVAVGAVAGGSPVPVGLGPDTPSAAASAPRLRAAAALPADPPGPQKVIDDLGVVGYPDQLSVEPGQSVKIMTSTKSASYTATMVRVVHGDADPRGPGIKEEVIPSPVNRTYTGKHQPLPLGSYVTVGDDSALRPSGSFTITAWIAPTTVPGSTLNPIAYQGTPAGTPRVQGIVTKWSEQQQRGYGLIIDEQGSLALKVAGANGAQTVSTGTRLKPWAPALAGVEGNPPGTRVRPHHVNSSGWYFVAASYDARTGKVDLYQLPMTTVPDDSAKTVTRSTGVHNVRHSNGPLIMAGQWQGPGTSRPGALYNGKIESPQIFDRALSRSEINSIRGGAAGARAVAAWDFSQKMDTTRVIDKSRNRLHGSTVNLPVRAVTGHNWAADEQDYKRAPEQYGALYFHDDDLYDAKWDTSFTWRVPDNARSGIYAARLESGGSVYHVTFVVRPKKPTSKVAFLVPMFSYLAYGQTGGTMSQYSRHADGSGYVYSSRLRPLQNLRSLTTGSKGEGRPWQFEADTHITDWLESSGYQVDYITDLDLHAQGAKLLKPYKAVLTGTHPEYISEQQLDAFQSWLGNGGRMMYMGGNGFYWVTTLDSSGTYTELRRHDGTQAWQGAPGEHYHSTTGEYGGLWRFRGRPPQSVVGVGFSAQGFASRAGAGSYSRPFDRTTASDDPRGSWVFKGVSARSGIGDHPSLQNPGGPAGEELDRADYALGTPDNTVVLATATGFGDEYMFVVEEIDTSSLSEGGKINPLVRADMTLMFYGNGGAVFSTSSISWAGSLYYNNYNNDVATITRNVLDTFVSGGPLPGTG